MLHIAIDTSIFRQDPSRQGLPFLAIERLCKGGIVKLHIPYVVEKEFQTQQIESLKIEFSKAHSALVAIVKKCPSIKSIQDNLSEEISGAIEETEKIFIHWANELDAVFHPLTLTEACNAMDAYFTGAPPFKEPKVRKDIPDSFIFQTILELSKCTDEIIFVVADKKLNEVCANLEHCRTFKSLNEFIELDAIQKELFELDIDDNVSIISQDLSQYEADFEQFSITIKKDLGDLTVNEVLKSDSIPDDNNEATIQSYDEPNNISLEFSNISYYGDGEFGIPFSADLIVSAYFYIFKSDYYVGDYGNKYSILNHDHNRHYMEAEGEFETKVEGLLKFQIEMKNFNINDLSKNVKDDSIEIVDIIDISVC